MRGAQTVIEKTTSTPMPPPPIQYHHGDRKASPIPPRPWRSTSRTSDAMSVEKARLATSASNEPIRSPKRPITAT
jgi:hypothetical protein